MKAGLLVLQVYPRFIIDMEGTGKRSAQGCYGDKCRQLSLSVLLSKLKAIYTLRLLPLVRKGHNNLVSLWTTASHLALFETQNYSSTEFKWISFIQNNIFCT